MASESVSDADATTYRDHWPVWFDSTLFTVIVGSLVVVFVGGFVQVSFGAFTMYDPTPEDTWYYVLYQNLLYTWFGVFNVDVLLNPQTWEAFILGAEVPDMSKISLVVWTLRMPRVVVAMLVGMNLAVSGAIFQAVTRNELASPFILGVSSGAGLMILLTLVVLSGFTLVIPLYVGELALSIEALLPIVAAIGGIVAFLIVYAIAWKNGTSPVRLVLAGVIVSTVFGSLQTGLFFFAEDIGVVQTAIQWTTGSLTGVGWEQVRMALPFTLIAMTLSLVASRQLNVLLLGESTASSLGMNVERVRFALSGVAVLAAAASIAVAGIVGFVGLIVPHMVRNIVGSDYKRLIIGCLFAGPALMIAADVGARLGLTVLLGSAGQMPVGIVTGLIGGPYFLYLMRKQETMGEI